MNTPSTEDPQFLLYCFALWLLCALLGTAIGSTAGKKGVGFALGTLLGPLGLILTAILCIGGKKPDPTPTYHPTTTHTHPQRNTPAPAATHIPDHLTIARDGTILGTWPLADVQDYLANGQLIPTDHFLHANGHTWLPLSRVS